MPSSDADLSADSDPWAVFETAAEVIAFAHKKLGVEGVKALLDQLNKRDVPAEFLQDAANQLGALGLETLAAMVTEAAQNAPPQHSLCPYPEGTYNAKAWLAGLRRRQQRWA